MARQSGFTLIELMVAIALFGVLASMAIPAFQSMVQSNRAATIANDLTGAIRLARSEAVKRGRNVVVCRRGVDNDCQDGTDWSVGWLARATLSGGGTQVLRVWDPPGGSPTLTGPATGVTFTARGDVTAGAAFGLQFHECSGEGRRTITVAPSGHNAVAGSACQ